MTNMTVADFAAELRKSPETLSEQLRCAGVQKGPMDLMTEADKYALLRYLKALHGTATVRKKISLVKPEAPPVAAETAQAKLLRRLWAEVMRQCVEVTVRGKRTLVVRESNGELARLGPREDHDGYVAPTNKVILVGSFLSDSFYSWVINRDQSIVAVRPHTLNKVISSFLRTTVDRAVPASQRGLCSKSGRTRRANLLGAANDLVRFEHVYPACAATISLA